MKRTAKTNWKRSRGAIVAELLLCLVFVLAGAATWCVTCPLPADDPLAKTAQEVATRELDRIRVLSNEPNCQMSIAGPHPAPAYFDKRGQPAGRSAAVFALSTTARQVIDHAAVRSKKDISEIEVRVTSPE